MFALNAVKIVKKCAENNASRFIISMLLSSADDSNNLICCFFLNKFSTGFVGKR